MKSFMASPATIERKWYVVDATGYTLGRLASEVAKVLREMCIRDSCEMPKIHISQRFYCQESPFSCQ